MCTHPMEKKNQNNKITRGVKGTFPGESVKGLQVEDARVWSEKRKKGRSRLGCQLAAGRWLKERRLSNQLPRCRFTRAHSIQRKSSELKRSLLTGVQQGSQRDLIAAASFYFYIFIFQVFFFNLQTHLTRR